MNTSLLLDTYTCTVCGINHTTLNIYILRGKSWSWLLKSRLSNVSVPCTIIKLSLYFMNWSYSVLEVGAIKIVKHNTYKQEKVAVVKWSATSNNNTLLRSYSIKIFYGFVETIINYQQILMVLKSTFVWFCTVI